MSIHWFPNEPIRVKRERWRRELDAYKQMPPKPVSLPDLKCLKDNTEKTHEATRTV